VHACTHTHTHMCILVFKLLKDLPVHKFKLVGWMKMNIKE